MKQIKYHKGKLRTLFRDSFVYIARYFWGRKPRVHRIPFGPIKGRRIYIAFEISPKIYLGIHDPWTAKLAKALIKRGDVVYDIGAHIGYTCLLFAQSLVNTGAVHAFEILPSTVEFLKKTVEVNEFNNIVVHNVGLGLSTQTVRLVAGPTAMTDIYSTPRENEKTESCEITSLDQYVKENILPPPSLVKIDVEGAEIDCLRGGYKLINKYKPNMLIEFHELRLLKEGYHLLESWGYRLIAQNTTVINIKQLEVLRSFHQTVLALPN